MGLSYPSCRRSYEGALSKSQSRLRLSECDWPLTGPSLITWRSIISIQHLVHAGIYVFAWLVVGAYLGGKVYVYGCSPNLMVYGVRDVS